MGQHYYWKLALGESTDFFFDSTYKVVHYRTGSSDPAKAMWKGRLISNICLFTGSFVFMFIIKNEYKKGKCT